MTIRQILPVSGLPSREYAAATATSATSPGSTASTSGSRPATVFGLLGPNGAGKTTLVRVLATLLRPTSGRARVLGHDVVAESLAVRRRIGLAGQFAAVDGELTGRENVEMVGRLYRLSAAEARARAAELLDRFGPSPQSPMTPKLPAGSRSYRDSRPQAALHQRPSGRSRSPRIDRSPSRRRPQGRAPR
jgi:ABC-type glutathione transport system ATPase component